MNEPAILHPADAFIRIPDPKPAILRDVQASNRQWLSSRTARLVHHVVAADSDQHAFRRSNPDIAARILYHRPDYPNVRRHLERRQLAAAQTLDHVGPCLSDPNISALADQQAVNLAAREAFLFRPRRK